MTRRLAPLGDAREAVGVVPGVERVGLVGGGELDAPTCGVIGVPHGALRSGLGRQTVQTVIGSRRGIRARPLFFVEINAVAT